MTDSAASAIPAQAGIQGSRIALLGAESTGKTQLAADLARHLHTAFGLRAAIVPEALRAWCERAGREPRPEEQLAIAREQEALADAAAATADIVVADTSALMVAIYAGMLYEDGELYRFALERQRAYRLTLVTGLDLPWVPDGLHRDASQPREAVDTLVRTHLQRAGVAYQVVYGQGAQRLQSALAALRGAPWVWNCEKCSDPACEHRLFTRLAGRR